MMSISTSYVRELIETTIDSSLRKILAELHAPVVPKENMLTRQQVADLLHISLTSLNKYTTDGVIKSYRIGNRILYKESEVLDSLEAIEARRYQR